MLLRAPSPLAGPLRGMIAFVAVTIATGPGTAQAEEVATVAAGCKLATIGTGIVVAVRDGLTLALEDGRDIRLSGIEVPRVATALAQETKSALESLVGQIVVLRRLGPDTDRYGRVTVQVFVTRDGAERWVQSDLVGRGYARVAARVGDRACATALVARERGARDGKLGLWAEPYYEIKRAEDAAGVSAEHGRFAIIEGKVLSVRESGGTIYVNFGRRWTEDFTLTIAKRNERTFTAAGVEPRKLQGRRVRVRGWVERRGGPWVEAVRPEQIEILERN
jgi:endonuclease YncB( thermonuclease family)